MKSVVDKYNRKAHGDSSTRSASFISNSKTSGSASSALNIELGKMIRNHADTVGEGDEQEEGWTMENLMTVRQEEQKI
ncbi:hypothetical protein TrLO_g11489 [Triparma laevis f. longispina]|uniref:Uncharacterized protein n=1 Tax=Triparma laevis f. longispina TaxID=1714387 RepID=A0A9W7CBF7_9STRA|nr:hypothetical protein TrLO_g11489 [Triparma laevis f. longispina]